MANRMDNLRPVRNTAEAQKRGRAGGKASGISKRKKKTMKEMLEILLSAKVNFEGEQVEALEGISIALIRRALSGDTKAFELIRDTIGQKPTDKLKAEGFSEARHFVFEIVKEKCKKQKE